MAKLTVEELAAKAHSGEIENVIVAASNLQGRLFGKRLPVDYFLEEGKNGVACTIAAYSGQFVHLFRPKPSGGSGSFRPPNPGIRPPIPVKSSTPDRVPVLEFTGELFLRQGCG